MLFRSGYGAFGEVLKTSNGAISGVAVNNGGSGFAVGEPVLLLSGSGTGAIANVATLSNTQNVLYLDLIIDPFTNASATVTMGGAEGTPANSYSAAGQATWNVNTTFTTVFAASDVKDYYTPWVWTNNANTSAELANVAILVANQTTSAFYNQNTAVSAGYTGRLFGIASLQDVTTNTSTATTAANTVGYFDDNRGGNVTHTVNSTKLYLKNVTSLGNVVVGQYLKQDYANAQVGTVTTNGSTIVVGTGTAFTSTLSVNAHVRIGNSSSGYDVLVQSITSDTQFTAAANANTVVANTYGVYAVGCVSVVYPRTAQSVYGTINSIALFSAGSGYTSVPRAVVESVDARVQGLFYYDANTDTVVSTSGRSSSVFASANLTTTQAVGAITRVKLNKIGRAHV